MVHTWRDGYLSTCSAVICGWMPPSTSLLKGDVCVYVCVCVKMKTVKELKEGTRYSIQNLISFHFIITCCSGEVLQMGFLIVMLNMFGREWINEFFPEMIGFCVSYGGSSGNSFQYCWEGQLRVMEARMCQPFKCMGCCSELCTLARQELRAGILPAPIETEVWSYEHPMV